MKKEFNMWLKYLRIHEMDFKDKSIRFKKKGNSDYIEKWYLEGYEIIFFTENNKNRLNNEELLNFYDQEYFLHLGENDLKSVDIGNFIVKKIDNSFKKQFETFQSEVSKDDKEAGFVELDHKVVFAAFDGEKIVSVSSVIDYGPFKDIGVITHPEYRQKNLGSATVKETTQWCLENEEIPLYRCESKNIGSLKTAEKIGYRKFIKIDAYK